MKLKKSTEYVIYDAKKDKIYVISIFCPFATIEWGDKPGEQGFSLYNNNKVYFADHVSVLGEL